MVCVRFAIALLSSIAMAPAAAFAQQELQPISAEDLAAPASLQMPTLSPSGSVIAAVSHTEEGDDILLIATDGSGALVDRIDATTYHISDINWAGENRLLFTVIADGLYYGYDIKMTRLIIYDRTTKQSVVGDEKARGIRAGEVLYVDDEGRFALVASQRAVREYPEVRRIDLATGEAETIQKPKDGVWNWFADTDGVLRLGLAIEGRRYKIYYRDDPNDSLDVIKGKFKQSEDDDDGVIERIYFNSQDDSVLALTNGPTGRFALYKYDIEAEQVGEEIFVHDKVDVSGVIRDADGGLLGVTYEDDRQRVRWFDQKLASIQRSLDLNMPDKANHILSFSKDRSRVLVRSESPDDPGQYFIGDLQNKRMIQLYRPFEKVEPAKLSPTSYVEYGARDGLKIPAYLTLPKGRESTGLPLILLPHGGPFSRDSWGYDPLVQFFASRGYAVFQPQFRGSTGYGRDYVEAGSGQWGRAMQDDLNDGLSWLSEGGTIDPDRVCIIGASYGGYAAMWGAIRDPELYRCAASFAGVSDLSQMLKEDRGEFSAKRYYRNWRDRVAGDIDRRDLDAFSPVDQAQRLKVPLFLAHGEEDPTVPVEHSRSMEKALRDAGLPVEAVYYPELGHGIYYSEHFSDWLNRLGDFVARHNPN